MKQTTLLTQPKNKGFTLIELLIVIALLGALVVGLIAALDPVEQIRRGRDATLRDQAAQLANAQNRLYASTGAYSALVNATAANLTALNGGSTTALAGDILTLVNKGELKATYLNAVQTNGAKIAIKGDAATPTTITVCYQPESKQFTTDTKNNCTDSGGTTCGTTYVAGNWTCLK